MMCGLITDDLMDEVILGRLRDGELVGHLEACPSCSIRFSQYRRHIADLRQSLAEWYELDQWLPNPKATAETAALVNIEQRPRRKGAPRNSTLV